MAGRDVPTTTTPPVVLPPVPDLPDRESGGGLLSLAPMLGGLGSTVAIVAFASPGQGRLRAWAMAGALLASTLLMVGAQLARQARTRQQSIIRLRAKYADALSQARAELDAAAALSRAGATPSAGAVRIGWASLTAPVAPAVRSPDADPACAALADQLAAGAESITGVPVQVDLGRGRLRITGTAASDAARALACTAVERGWGVTWRGPQEPWLEWVPTDREESIEVAVDASTTVVSWTGADTSQPRGAASTLDLETGWFAQPGDSGRPLRPDLASPMEALVRLRRAVATQAMLSEVAGAAPPITLDPDAVDFAEVWRRRGPGSLTTLIGTTESGHPLRLDLRESAMGGMGPHGVLIGATGSGKSELLRTLVLGLAMDHSPAQLSLLLVDFKGGAAFAGLAGLPHVCGFITNLANEPGAVERVQAALEGEVTRRQRLLAEAGFSSVHAWAESQAAQPQAAGQASPPSLVIVIDEFAELLAERPEFLQTLITIGRLGRSLGLHLVLGSQRLDEGRLRGLEAHLAFRIALRTFSEAESHQVLGCPDAALLPRTPGVGILRPGPGQLVRFRSGYVSGPCPYPRPDQAREPLRLRLPGWREPEPETPSVTSGLEPPTILDRALARMHQTPPEVPTRQIWLPSLPTRLTLGELDQRPRHSAGPVPEWLPLGVVDLPAQQRRALLRFEWSAPEAAHLAVVGSTRSGKTTALTTLALGLARALAPDQLSLWIFDGTRGLGTLSGLPHVRAMATNDEPDLVRRAAAELLDRLDRSPGRHRDLVLVDGWESISSEHPQAAEALTEIVARGLSAGVQVALTARRWGSLRPSFKEAFGRRIELRLGDPLDSEVDRRMAAALPATTPGRGLIAGPHEVQLALPVLSVAPAAGPTLDEPARDSAGLDAAVSEVVRRWPATQATRMQPLPTLLSVAELEFAPQARLGLRESGEPWLMPEGLLVVGGPGTGRSSLLATAADELTRTAPPSRRQILLLRPRGSGRSGVADDWLLADARDPASAATAISALADVLRDRLDRSSPTDSTPKNPDIWLLADDAELLGRQVWAPLEPFLPRSNDLGLHLVVALRAHGVARFLHEPVPDHLLMRGETALLAGPPEEGPVAHGHRLRKQPPGRALVVRPNGSSEPAQVAFAAEAGRCAEAG